MVSLYVEVDDVDAFVSRAMQLGGQLIIPRQKLPDGDEMAVILDVEGIPVGLFKPAAD
jgi:predicted enzyme related to lactoylglutathione lyase